jgi:hypothetical protein
LGVVEYVNAAVANAGPHAGGSISHDLTELLGGATLAPDIAAGTQRAEIENADVGSRGRFDWNVCQEYQFKHRFSDKA